MCLMPYSFNHDVKVLPVNWDPLSDVSAVGNPHLVNVFVSWFTTVLAVVFRIGIASGHLVALSMHVSKNLKQSTAFGNGPTISSLHSRKGLRPSL